MRYKEVELAIFFFVLLVQNSDVTKEKKKNFGFGNQKINHKFIKKYPIDKFGAARVPIYIYIYESNA